MAKIYLINVGANTSHRGTARSPIFRDETWIYVPFPQDKSNKEGQPFPEETLRFVRDGRSTKCHPDPDWEWLTYGDNCKGLRGRDLLKAQKGDILLFWALLWRTDYGACIFKSHDSDRGWYLIGALRVESVLESGQKMEVLPPDICQRAGRNAHVYEGQVKPTEGERVFVGSCNRHYSGPFAKAVDLEVYRDGGLMHRVVRTKDGRQIRWEESPRWNSVTRPCRAILDLDVPRDRRDATFLAGCIRMKNEGFDLIDSA